MSETMEFVFNSKTLRATMIENKPWFAGVDVAKILCYGNPHGAIKKHVNESDKIQHSLDVKSDFISGSSRKTGVIMLNESGLDSLNSKLNIVEGFKTWITEEVIPAMRKNGDESTEKCSEDVEETCVDKSLEIKIQHLNAKARLNNSVAKKADVFLKLAKSEHFSETDKKILAINGANVLTGEKVLTINQK